MGIQVLVLNIHLNLKKNKKKVQDKVISKVLNIYAADIDVNCLHVSTEV